MRDLDYIYEIYKCKSFSKAAANLFITQPALSATVKKIETQLGITIFDRNSSPILPTEEGKIYIESIEEILNIEKSTKQKLADMSKLQIGSLIISGENFVTSFILPSIITEFSKNYPGIDVNIVESNYPDLKQQLLNESIDLLISHAFDDALYDTAHLFDEEMLLAVPKKLDINKGLEDFRLDIDTIKDLKKIGNAKGVKLSKFKDETFLMLKPGNDTYARAQVLFSEAKIDPNISIYLDQLITAYNMACAGLGIAIVSNALIYKAGNTSNCFYYKIDGKNTKRSMYIGYKKNRYLSKACKAMIDTAIQVYSI